MELTIKGHIPTYAAGALYRTGPGEYDVEDTPTGTFRTTHWFDGFGHTHRFDIIPDSRDPEKPTRVEYSSRRQTQDLVDAIKRSGNRRQTICFGQRQEPCIGLFGKIMTVWQNPSVKLNGKPDNISVTVQANIPDFSLESQSTSPPEDRSGIKNVWLTTDSNNLRQFDTQTLEPIGYATQERLHPDLKGPLSCAHAQRDPKTGDFFNYNLEMGFYTTYRVFRVNASDGTTDILATICESGVKPAYIHSFFLSSSFVILCIPSTHLSTMGVKVMWERNIVDAIEPFDESKLCKWFVIDRVGDRGVVARFESDAGFFFHTVNSFEERDEATGDINVFCDVIRYKTPEVIRIFEMDVLLQRNSEARRYWGDEARNRNTHSRLDRYKLRIPGKGSEEQRGWKWLFAKKSKVEAMFEIKAPHVGELPTINPLFATRKYRYVYSLPNRGYSTLLDSLAKTDLETRETLFWDNPKGHTPGEAVFVPRPRTSDDGEGELDEDDGVLLSVVLDGFGKTSYLLCLNAKTMTELGRAECEWAVAFGFHGLHTSSIPPI